MEGLAQVIFQTEHPEVVKVYQEQDNFLITYYDGPEAKKDICVVYFSSNDLYFPNTLTAFNKSILQKNRFEWKRNIIKRGHKHIFLRDVQKQWYIEGVNAALNTPEKLTAFLQEETKGFKSIFVGSSAGGFAALHYGSKLNATRVYAFNAQLDLNVTIQNSNLKKDPLLFKYQHSSRKDYLRIDTVLNHTTDYLYFQSSKSGIDVDQYLALEDKEKILRIPFKTTNHGFPFLRYNLPDVLTMGKGELKAIAEKEYHPFLFLVSREGWLKAITVVFGAVKKRVRKKIEERRANQ